MSASLALRFFPMDGNSAAFAFLALVISAAISAEVLK
jgi:hypothetical protein